MSDKTPLTLVWGVKQSFRGYVDAMGGVTEAAGGATRTADGAFAFPPASDSDLARDASGALSGTGRFQGEVRFDAHGGMLKVFLADPAVEIGPDGAALTVADSPARDRRIAIASLDLSAAAADADGALSLPAKLTIDGYFLLGDHYPPGTLVDPVLLAPAPGSAA
jgi:hypothetical protein